MPVKITKTVTTKIKKEAYIELDDLRDLIIAKYPDFKPDDIEFDLAYSEYEDYQLVGVILKSEIEETQNDPSS